MGAVIFSDVHADADALAALRSCIRIPAFSETFGPVDTLINLGDVLHRGNHPEEAIECITLLAQEYRLVSLMGNHDHAFLNGIMVSGSDEESSNRHEQCGIHRCSRCFMRSRWNGQKMVCCLSTGDRSILVPRPCD